MARRAPAESDAGGREGGIRKAAKELKEIIFAGAKAAEMKVKEGRQLITEKQAELDAEEISRMGELSSRFSESFEDMISEISTRPYAQQEQIYSGFIKLIDYQRELLAARKDFATRLKDSVTTPVVTKEEQEKTERVGMAESPVEDSLIDVDVYSKIEPSKGESAAA